MFLTSTRVARVSWDPGPPTTSPVSPQTHQLSVKTRRMTPTLLHSRFIPLYSRLVQEISFSKVLDPRPKKHPKSWPKRLICKVHDCIFLTWPIIERERTKERYLCRRKQMHLNKSSQGKANTRTHWAKRLTASKESELNVSNLSPCDRPTHFIITYLYHQRERKHHTANITKYSTLFHFLKKMCLPMQHNAPWY